MSDGPDDLRPDTPVVFSMHGVNRDASDYRDDFVQDRPGGSFILLCPRFDGHGYPHAIGYNLGNMFADQALQELYPPPRWVFTAIEGIFDAVREACGGKLQTDRYQLYGHSAGAQLVHRMV